MKNEDAPHSESTACEMHAKPHSSFYGNGCPPANQRLSDLHAGLP
jgi:hypothetical protein